MSDSSTPVPAESAPRKQHFAPRIQPTHENPRGLVEGDRVDIEWNHALMGVAPGRPSPVTDGVHVVVLAHSANQYATEPRLVLVPEAVAADPEALHRIRVGFDPRFLGVRTNAALGMYETNNRQPWRTPC